MTEPKRQDEPGSHPVRRSTAGSDTGITVWYDYTCGDSYRFKLLLDQLGQRASWRTVSLKELRRHDDEPTNFGDIESISVLALALTHAVDKQKVGGLHDALFRAFHERDDHVEPDDLLAIAETHGVNGKTFRSKPSSSLRKLAKEHREAVEKWGVFGTPTLMIDGSHPVYIEVSEVPTSRRGAQKIWAAIEKVIATPGLREVKRV